MKRCIIVGAGELYGNICYSDGDLLLAADGGYDKIRDLGFLPDALIGDLDSVKKYKVSFSEKVLRHSTKKDDTDMRLCYEYGKEQGCDTFYIYGGTGGREDHTFANYCLLLEAKNEGNNVYLMGNGWKVYCIKNEEIKLYRREGKRVSVFAFGGEARGVTIKGLEYEAENITLSESYPLGVSNSYAYDVYPTVSVTSGSLLIFEEL